MLTKAQTTLFSMGIIQPDGSPRKDKLNVISGVYATPFAEAVWIQCDHDHATCEILLFLFRSHLEDGEDGDALSLLLLLYGMIGYKVPEDITVIAVDPATLHLFLQEFLLDLDDIFAEMMAETA
jgi:hypothetical protein